MMRKQVVYFYEGETEKKLLEFLKNTKKIIRPGRLKKFNLWKWRFKSIEKLYRTHTLFFVVDTDDVQNNEVFINNIKTLKLRNSHNFCLIAQDSNLEDELLSACNIENHKKLFYFFYHVTNLNTFKTKFAQDKNLSHTLSKNNFDFLKLWERNKNFTEFLDKNFIKVDYSCNYRVSPLHKSSKNHESGKITHI